jgi:three-Cys-motif partner protein
MSKDFFRESREQSEVKTLIVSKYFWAWANVIIPQTIKWGGPNPRIAYIDLFAGPGRYENGTKSTPLLILEQAINDSKMSQMLVTLFNDFDSENTKSLATEIEKLPDIHKLKYKPSVMNQEVGTEIVKMFEEMKLIPTLFFVDPWGYKGLSLRLINSVLKDWGCDCIFFFNYNRINMGLKNDAVKHHMEVLFGEERAELLRNQLNIIPHSEDRELKIVETIVEALKEMGGKYVLPFRFKNNRGSRTSHHLIFVSKHFRGYEIMKDIMAGMSSKREQNVASFEYSPADIRYPTLFEYSRPLDDLYDLLLNDFAGCRLKMRDIYEAHNIGKPYVSKNYKEVLKNLETDGKIKVEVSTPGKTRRKGTFSDDLIVTFPKKVDSHGKIEN